MFTEKLKTVTQEVHLSCLKDTNNRLFLKREDLIHPLVSGNKFRKLSYNIKEALQQQKKKLLTFGGAFSNHILATAAAGKIAGLETIGVIRGDELGRDLSQTLASNPTLRAAHANGMQFHFMSREQYRLKNSEDVNNDLLQTFGDVYIIPEGGTNQLAVKGCEEILTNKDQNFSHICVAVGTGGTIAGLINSSSSHQQVLGFPALKGSFLENEIQALVGGKSNWKLIEDYHFGGYAKYTPDLIAFINEFTDETGILLDPIYTGKMLFGIINLIQKGHFKENSTILAIHTGGIQGVEGFNQRLAKKNQETIKGI